MPTLNAMEEERQELFNIIVCLKSNANSNSLRLCNNQSKIDLRNPATKQELHEMFCH